MGPIGFPKTLVTNYKSRLCNFPVSCEVRCHIALVEDILLCLMSYKINKLIIAAIKHNIFSFLVFPILMVTPSGPFNHHPAILEKFKVSAVQLCSMGSHNAYCYIKIYMRY